MRTWNVPIVLSIITIFALTPAVFGQPWESSLVFEDTGGNLVYGVYANEGEPNEAVHILPDWSFSGYMGGGVPLPEVPVAATVSPGAGDDTAAIQTAIDFVAGLPPDGDGFRGAVLLTAGRYQVASTLFIDADGVVLRGEGQDALGTILELTTPVDYDGIRLGAASGTYSRISGTTRAITTPYVPVGAVSFDVVNTSGYTVGDEIVIERNSNQFWIDDLDMGQWGWTPDGYQTRHQRQIVDISGNTITVDAPIVDTFQEKYGGGEIFKSEPIGRIKHSGVENLRLESTFAFDTDESHPWDAVRVQYAEDCWVRRVTSFYFAYACVNVGGYARRCTIEDCACRDPKSIITGSRRYSFNIDGNATRILFQRCISEHGRHDFVTGARTTGPNAWVDCRAYNSHSDTGPHHRWSTGLLFDNVDDDNSIKVQNRESAGTGHGWSGAQTLFWNCRSSSMVCDAPKGAMNYAIGALATQSEGNWDPNAPFGIWEHLGQSVTPRSLYYRQLQERLGEAAVEAVTLPEQRAGNIWDLLREWNGEYTLQSPPIEASAPGDRSLVFGVDLTFEVIPLPGATIQSYQWYEINGSSAFAVGENSPALIIPKARKCDEGREFFCRVVTDAGPYLSRRASIHGIKTLPVSANLQLFDNFETGAKDDSPTSGVLGGIRDNESDGTGNSEIQNFVGNPANSTLTYGISGHSSGDERGVTVTGVDNPIAEGETGVLFFRFAYRADSRRVYHWLGITSIDPAARSDPLDSDNENDPNQIVSAGILGVRESFSPTDPIQVVRLHDVQYGDTDIDEILYELTPQQWYDFWIEADNDADIFNVYIQESTDPGGPPPAGPNGPPVLKNEPFNIPGTDALRGWINMHPDDDGTDPRPWPDPSIYTYTDDLWWDGDHGLVTEYAHNPGPENGATLVSSDAVLAWEDPDKFDPLTVAGFTYNVYFGTMSPDANCDGNPLVVSDQDVNMYDPGPLEADTIYYWRVDVMDPNDGGEPIVTKGNCWFFATGLGYLEGDVDRDGTVTLRDFGYISSQWGGDGAAEPSADIAPACGDAVVDIQDMLEVALNFLEFE